MLLEEIIKPDSVLCNAHARSKKHCLEILSELLVRSHPGIASEDIFEGLIERERLGCTSLKQGVALPHGIGLATGDVAKKILNLAGVHDCWAFTKGKTKTTVNYANAVFNALKENTTMRVVDKEIRNIGIVEGSLDSTVNDKQYKQIVT